MNKEQALKNAREMAKQFDRIYMIGDCGNLGWRIEPYRDPSPIGWVIVMPPIKQTAKEDAR